MPGRTYSNGSSYRYSINGQEKSSEVNDNLTTAKFWEYDSRIGRRWNLDPSTSKFPWQSPYSVMDDNPILKNDPSGESGIVTIDKAAKTLTITSTYTFYGNGASAALAKSTAQSIQDNWNNACGTTKIDGVEYQVKFVVKSEYVKDPKSQNNPVKSTIENNKDYSKNFIKVTIEDPTGKGSATDPGNSSGQWWASDIDGKGLTSGSHEYGHGLGEPDADLLDEGKLIGKGQPGIMAQRGTRVDAKYTYDPKAGDSKEVIDKVTGKKTSNSNTVDPSKRIVTQQNIDDLHLDTLKFDDKGNANLGPLSNIYHP